MMAVQYTCSNQRRRDLLVGGSTNGLDHVVVWDADIAELGLGDAYRQRIVDLHFINPYSAGSLTAVNLSLDGGERVQSIVIESVEERNDGPPSSPIYLRLTLNQPGDFAEYTLSLVTSRTDDAVPPGWDPILSCIALYFKADCPTDFDCQVDDSCPTEASSAPTLDYLARDYESLRQLILDRLSVTLPGWSETNPVDLGVTLVEILAHAGDQLSYYQDAVATEAYLGTARRRVSVRRHARLLDYAMHEGLSARVWVHVEVLNGCTLPAGTQLFTRIPGAAGRLSPDTTAYDRALSRIPLIFETLHSQALEPERNRIRFYTWGDRDCCLPEGATRATLIDPHFTDVDLNARLGLAVGDVLLFEEIKGAATGLEADADASHRHVVRLTAVEALEDPIGAAILGEGTSPTRLIAIEWAAEDALPFPLCLSTTLDSEPIDDISIARGNLILADHGRTLDDEQLDEVPTSGRYRPLLAERGLSFAAPYDHDAAAQEPAAYLLDISPIDGLPQLVLTDGYDPWAPAADLLSSARFDKSFVVEMEDDGRAFLRFGDGIYGSRPRGGATLTASYRVGMGANGNVGSEAIAHIVTSDTAVRGVRNPLAASGGRDAEGIDEVKLNAPVAFRTQLRAVTPADYVEVAERHPQVRKAVASRRWTGSWFTTFLVVDREGGREVDDAFQAEVRAFLESYRLAGHDLEIEPPRFVPLDIAFTVCVKSEYFSHDVRLALLSAFSDGVQSDGSLGYFHPDNFSFGQPVYLSRIVAQIMAVPGVNGVDTEIVASKPHRFHRWGESDHGESDAGYIDIAEIEVAQLSNDPNAPESGRLVFHMEGGR